MSKGVIANFVVKVVLDTIKSATNFPIACPFKKVCDLKFSECHNLILIRTGHIHSIKFQTVRRFYSSSIAEKPNGIECKIDG